MRLWNTKGYEASVVGRVTLLGLTVVLMPSLMSSGLGNQAR
jgi:hypothetical protein